MLGCFPHYFGICPHPFGQQPGGGPPVRMPFGRGGKAPARVRAPARRSLIRRARRTGLPNGAHPPRPAGKPAGGPAGKHPSARQGANRASPLSGPLQSNKPHSDPARMEARNRRPDLPFKQASVPFVEGLEEADPQTGFASSPETAAGGRDRADRRIGIRERNCHRCLCFDTAAGHVDGVGEQRLDFDLSCRSYRSQRRAPAVSPRGSAGAGARGGFRQNGRSAPVNVPELQ